MTSPLGVNVRCMLLCVWQKTTEATTRNVSRRRGAGAQPIRATSGCAPLRAGRKERPHTERGGRCWRPGDRGLVPVLWRPSDRCRRGISPFRSPLVIGGRGACLQCGPGSDGGRSRGHTRATGGRIPLTEAPKGREHSACDPPRFGGFRCELRPVRNAALKKRPKHSRRGLLTSRLLR